MRIIFVNKGFSLIELVVAIAIVGIIAAIAIPSYQGSMRKAIRSDAKAALMDVAARQERFFTENNSYTVTLSNLGYTGSNSPEGYYSLTAVAGPTGSITTSFTASASLIASGNDSSCSLFRLSSNGAKSATSSSCW